MNPGEPSQAVLGTMWLLGQHKTIHLEKEPAQGNLCEQLLSRKDLSDRPVQVPAGPGPLLQGQQRCQGGWDTPFRLYRPSRRGTVTSTLAELKHLLLQEGCQPRALQQAQEAGVYRLPSQASLVALCDRASCILKMMAANVITVAFTEHLLCARCFSLIEAP